jgi:GDP-L-fucose synthase
MNKRVCVTGGAGFLGSHVVDKFCKEGYEVVVPRQEEYDLRKRSVIEDMLTTMSPDIVVHLAAKVGGIGANQANPGSFFYDNAVMGVELIDAAYRHGVEKFVQVGTVCAYPSNPPIPFKEADLWNGYPEPTNAPYGIAKRMLLEMLQSYRKQYGLNGIYLLPVNLYGPRDNFDLETSHVIPALVRKTVEAKASGTDRLSVWGTGNAYREFLYVEDAAEAIFLATEKYNSPEPVNIGTGNEISMKDLVELIKKAVGFEGSITWDTSRPDGSSRRCLDVSKAISSFGFSARTKLEEGIAKTIAWYAENTHSNI